MAARNDVASFSINLTLPPEVIKAYFDGQAKVEAAKAKPSSFEWSSLLPLVPLVLPFFTGASSSSSVSKRASTPKPAPKSSETPSSLPTPTDPHAASEVPAKESPSPSENAPSEAEPAVLEAMSTTFTQFKEASVGAVKAIDDIISAPTPTASESSTPASPVTIPLPGGGPPLTVDFSSLGAGANGMNEMLKNFMPLLEGFTSAFGPPKSSTTPTASSSTPSADSAEAPIQAKTAAPADEPKKDPSEVTPIEAVATEGGSGQTTDLN